MPAPACRLLTHPADSSGSVPLVNQDPCRTKPYVFSNVFEGSESLCLIVDEDSSPREVYSVLGSAPSSYRVRVYP